MTKEKAIELANCLKNNYTINFDDISDFCDKAIDALEDYGKECEETVSRQQVLDIVKFEEKWLKDAKSNSSNTDIAFSGIMDRVKKLPLVTTTRKKGKWVKSTEMTSTVSTVKCPICGREFVFLMSGTNLKFCPNCGSQMSYE
jgi:ribosomal protein S27E